MAKDAARQQQGGFDGRTTVAVIGVGSFAQGLVSLAVRSGAEARYAFRFGSRRVQQGCNYHLPGLEKVPVCSIDDALVDADIVVLAIPVGSVASMISQYGNKLAHKVVVDVMNPWGKDLMKLTSYPCTSMLPVDTESLSNNMMAAGGADSTGAAYGADLPDCNKTTAKDVDLVTDIADTTDSRKGLTTVVTTPSSTAAWLAAVLPASAPVVKAFCNLSAYSLLHGDPLTEHMKSVAASDHIEAAETVAQLGRAMGIEVRTVGKLSYASVLESRQHCLMKVWQWPTLLMVATWLVVHIYSFIRYNYFGGTPWQHATMWILNKSVGWVALWGMVYTYLPGVLVCYMQLVTRKPSLRLPHWMKIWLDGRKQLGLLSLAAMLLHLLLSTFLWMPSYYAKLWDNTDAAIVPIYNNTTAIDLFGMPKGVKGTAAASTAHVTASSIKSNISLAAYHMVHVNNVITIRSRLNWVGESSTLLGIISGCLMGLIALTSMPSVTPKLNWREWRLLQSQAGWLALITATVHVLLLGAPWWPKYKTDWPAMIPTITLMSTIPPMLLLLLKGLVSLPPLSWVLARVGSGRLARHLTNAEAINSTPVYAVAHM